MNPVSSVCVNPNGYRECGQNGKRDGSSDPMTGSDMTATVTGGATSEPLSLTVQQMVEYR